MTGAGVEHESLTSLSPKMEQDEDAITALLYMVDADVQSLEWRPQGLDETPDLLPPTIFGLLVWERSGRNEDHVFGGNVQQSLKVPVVPRLLIATSDECFESARHRGTILSAFDARFRSPLTTLRLGDVRTTLTECLSSQTRSQSRAGTLSASSA